MQAGITKNCFIGLKRDIYPVFINQWEWGIGDIIKF